MIRLFAVFAHLPTNRVSKTYPVTIADLEKHKRLYPSVDVEQQLQNLEGWLDGHPTRRNTLNRMPGLYTEVLSKEQSEGGPPEVFGDDSQSFDTLSIFSYDFHLLLRAS